MLGSSELLTCSLKITKNVLAKLIKIIYLCKSICSNYENLFLTPKYIYMMKKFYMTLGLTLAGLTAFANLTLAPVQRESKMSGKVANAKIEKRAHSAEATRAGSVTVDDILGKYVFDEYSVVENNSGWHYGWTYPSIVKDEGNKVIINNFWNFGTDIDDIVGQTPATFNPATGVLSIAPGAPLGTIALNDGTNPTLYVYIQDWDSYECLNKSLDFTYDEATHTFHWEAEGDSYGYTENIIITDVPNAVGSAVTRAIDFMVVVDMCQYNAVGASLILDEYGEATQIPYPIYTEKTAENKFSVLNFCNQGYFEPFEFTVNPNDNTVTAPKALFAKDYPMDYYAMDIYLEGPNGGDITGNLAVTNENGEVTTTVNLGTINFSSPDVSMLLLETTASQFSIPFDLMNYVGVKAIEFDENAPIEYFNLQGMRVANPEKGTIVIARQGNKVAKIIAK